MASEINADLIKLQVSIEILSQKLDEIIRIYRLQLNENPYFKNPVIQTERNNYVTELSQTSGPSINCDIPWF